MGHLLWIPFFMCGFGWFWLIVGLVILRDKLFHGGNDPHGGTVGSLIEWGIYQSIAGIITVVASVMCFTFFSPLIAASIVGGWIIWTLINLIWVYGFVLPR